MKNRKLNLDELKVKSFVTDFENGEENTVKGGLFRPGRDTLFDTCDNYNYTEAAYCTGATTTGGGGGGGGGESGDYMCVPDPINDTGPAHN